MTGEAIEAESIIQKEPRVWRSDRRVRVASIRAWDKIKTRSKDVGAGVRTNSYVVLISFLSAS
jgi:hypothetical protein